MISNTVVGFRYHIDLPKTEPDGKAIPVVIHSVTPVRSFVEAPVSALPSTLINAWRIDSSISTPANFYVRVQRWNLGVQAYSISVRGKMNLSMRVKNTLAMRADFSEVPPAMRLEVNVETASISIDRFEVERISKIGGDVAEELGDLAENTIGKIWLRKENKRLVHRLNSTIEKNRDDLRWSMADWLALLSP